MLNCLKFHHIIHNTTASMHQQIPSTVLAKNDILGSWFIAWCKLAPTLARKYDVIIMPSAALNI